jgi:hypothetical protein
MSDQDKEKIIAPAPAAPHPEACDCSACQKAKDRPMTRAEAKGFEPTIPVGVFLMVFGLVVLGAAFLEMGTTDKMINAGSGAILIGIGIFCYAIGWFRKRRRAKTGA